MQKLIHTLGYLCSMQQTTLVSNPTKPMQVKAYIDAAFTAHDDSKSHSGVAVFIAGVFVYASSRKKNVLQKAQLRVSVWCSPTT
jgi:hypothetical protein